MWHVFTVHQPHAAACGGGGGWLSSFGPKAIVASVRGVEGRTSVDAGRMDRTKRGNSPAGMLLWRAWWSGGAVCVCAACVCAVCVCCVLRAIGTPSSSRCTPRGWWRRWRSCSPRCRAWRSRMRTASRCPTRPTWPSATTASCRCAASRAGPQVAAASRVGQEAAHAVVLSAVRQRQRQRVCMQCMQSACLQRSRVWRSVGIHLTVRGALSCAAWLAFAWRHATMHHDAC